MNLSIACYSGYKVDHRPVRFRLRDAPHAVEQIMEQWRWPNGECFQVGVTGGGLDASGVSMLRR